MTEVRTTDKVKKFCFTLNNYTEEEYQQILSYAPACLFLVVAKEVGKEGTPHLQGFANLKKQVRFSAIKQRIPRAHLEKARGTDEQNLAYCTKDDKAAFVHGEPQYRGKRNDLAKACEMIKDGATIAQLADELPATVVKYSRGLHELVELQQKPREVEDPPTVVWVHGKAGVGKTRLAFDQMPHDQIYIKDGTPWWNGYTHQQCIVVDDFDDHWPYRDFLRFLDRYPYRGQVKGGYVEINSPIIYITCEFPPSHFWHDNELAQVARRISHIIHLEK